MKKKLATLIALAFALAMVLTACGASKEEASPEPEAQETVKNTATATMDEGEFPVDVTVDVSSGLSVLFSSDGFSLFEGEYDDSTYPAATATILTQEVYDKYIADNKDSEDYREEDGFIKYTSSIGEPVCLWMIGDKIPFMISFEKSIDGDRADEIIKCLEFDY